MPLINCKVNLILIWSANFVITSMKKQKVTAEQGGNPAVFDNSLTGAMLAIPGAKSDVDVAALSMQDDNKL